MHSSQTSNSSSGNLATMERYLAELVNGGDFTDIAMRSDVRFRGPLASAHTAEEYRLICQQFAESVHDITVRTLVSNRDVVHAVYEVDLGLPAGPLATSQTVEFIDGAFAVVDVIFDAAVLTGASS